MNLSTGEEVYSYNSDNDLVPASVTKVITAAAALHKLTASFRFRTEILTNGEVEDGVLNGNLYVKGGGDPYVNGEVIQLIRDLASMEQIKGKLYSMTAILWNIPNPCGERKWILPTVHPITQCGLRFHSIPTMLQCL